MSCSCHMCGRKSAGANNARKDYLQAGAKFDEGALANPKRRKETKKASHRALRRQGKREAKKAAQVARIERLQINKEFYGD